ncbi:hypothetical protein [Aliarcobacter butzleri]|uniref:hypothetical protein n=2 Tax=Aliarcobacter butzleri TaxID=28197 RepID=UPI0021B2FC4B|nr:hypothetical protein [Aliarcobacter butzleri]MCT7552985.1 hypothetical protein [Aliarcobacter butzleri]MCT7610679.1 hypothetical protein [Aliarcobacter butzleri]
MMVSYSDIEYIETKKILLKEKNIHPDFIELINFINQEYGLKPINIFYDLIDNNKTTRINIIFEDYEEANSFRTAYNYDEYKQKIISNKIRDILNKYHKYKLEKVFVCFSAFKPLAIEEIKSNILNKFKKDVFNCKDIWKINDFFGITIFFYTNKQVQEYKNSDLLKLWTNEIFNFLKNYDKFNYINKENFYINLESKETIDNKYDGNLFHYWHG